MSTESNTPVDPRVQVELEKLNTATDNINKYEVELDEAKCDFKRILAESDVRIKQAAHKLGNSIEAAKPYYESRIYAAQLAKETQQAAVNYEKAKSIHCAAKEMVYLAEQGLGEKATLDTACQEMLSHATTKVNQSQVEVTDARNALKMCQLKLEVANNRVGKLQGQLKQAIRASSLSLRRDLLEMNSLVYQHRCNYLPFYEARANYNGLLKAQKQKINELESKVTEAKMTYNEALKNLEQISEDIHRQRQVQRDLLNDTLLPELCVANKTTAAIVQKYQNLPCDELDDAAEEYLQLPAKLSTQSSPVHQRRFDEHECPHLLQDFPTLNLREKLTSGGMHKSASTNTTGDGLFVHHAQLHGPYEVKSAGGGSGSGGTGSGSAHDASSSTGADADEDIEQWTEIRLSHSESTSSSYSNQSLLHDQQATAEDAQSHHSSSSSSDEPKRKVTCTTIFHDDQLNKKQSLSQWLSRSNSLKMSGRRQSLDLLIDAGDKVKDVFSFGFQKVGKTLERRNSESEMNAENADNGGAAGAVGAASGGGGGGKTSSAGDFFLFSRSTEPKELLSDEQVENLLLNPILDENGVIIVEQLKSPLQQPNQFGLAATTPTSTTTSTTTANSIATLLF
ncbi:SH3 domain-binding protein 5-like isoform X2 [Ceratitis capitata]|uniref:SH3 domain-binding protein 5-like isoform X2 n=1 Tax=Ceratitis capitata TaxID=7213 RepID=UPI0006187F60|nr:SH3 domain-binding protein 5-like isoform X2 [Ceratitis capitata]